MNNLKIIKYSKEWKKKISDTLKRNYKEHPEMYKKSINNLKKLAKERIGKCLSEETKLKIGLKSKNRKHTKEVKYKISLNRRGIKCSDKQKNLMSKKFNGKGNPFYGKKHSKETKLKMRLAKLGKKLSKEHKIKIGLASKGYKMTDEDIRKSLRRNIPTSLETAFQVIIDKYKLPYKYVGDGSFLIGRKNPDFVNTDGAKVVIEVYAKYYKLRNNISIVKWKKDRKKVFKDYGWDVIFFDETQVKDNIVLKGLGVIKKIFIDPENPL